jgi:hypothetical protein
MKWIEIIELRSVSHRCVLQELDLESFLTDASLAKKPCAINVYRHGTIETDFSVHLIYDSKQVDIHGSVLGEQLTSFLKEFGLVNHTVWVKTPQKIHRKSTSEKEEKQWSKKS